MPEFRARVPRGVLDGIRVEYAFIECDVIRITLAPEMARRTEDDLRIVVENERGDGAVDLIFALHRARIVETNVARKARSIDDTVG